MRKKRKAAANDFTEIGLPHNRLQVFFDILKQRYDVVFKIGVTAFFFLLPLLVVRLISGMTLMDMEDSGAAQDEIVAFCRTVAFVNVAPIAFFGFGLAGIMKIVRNLAWGEPVFFMTDLFSGIRQNRVNYVFVFVIAGVVDFVLVYTGGLIENEYLRVIPTVFCLVFLLPLGLFVLSATAVYKDGLLAIIKNSLKFYVKNAPVCFLFVLALGGAFLTLNIELLVVRFILVIVLIIALLPLFLISWTLFSHSVFDKMVNAKYYPEYVDKGVYRIK